MDFQERIKQLLNYYNLTAYEFAEKIGIQRSSVSHFLSGRNKPSLDFLIKLKKSFSNFNLDWFVTGKGDIEKSNEVTNVTSLRKIKNNGQLIEIIKVYDDGTFETLRQSKA
jgi:transcriptional regulator with XRE-family HTH domain